MDQRISRPRFGRSADTGCPARNRAAADNIRRHAKPRWQLLSDQHGAGGEFDRYPQILFHSAVPIVFGFGGEGRSPLRTLALAALLLPVLAKEGFRIVPRGPGCPDRYFHFQRVG